MPRARGNAAVCGGADASTRSLPPDEYTVGWICALPKEALPATLLLDEEYATALDSSNDSTSYTFGRMGDHKVVIATLPKGTYGQASAAVVGTNLFRSFPSIKFYLLVGIGAGIPSTECDIRLGDVVVGSPDGSNGALVHFDFGSQHADGTFQLKGRAISPPRYLLNALSKFETEHQRNNSPIHKYISTVQKLQARFQNPGAQHDHLFPPEYPCCTSAGSACRDCDRTYSDPRRSGPRETSRPTVHYGVIASGGKLVRDPFLRDKLMNTYKARCIEMEAAGLVNDLDCLVIRGVSDYADSHKNDVWHGYASLTACACAKAILGYIPPVPVQGTLQMMKALRTMAERKRRHQAMVDLLGPFDFSQGYSDLLLRRHANTGQWLLETAEFQEWLANTGGTLWCSGMPGAGKTILAAIAIHHLQSVFAGRSDVAVLFAFCHHKDTMNQTGPNIIASFWRQLMRRRILSDEEYADLESTYLETGISPTPKQLLELLAREMRRYRRVFILLDALDELALNHRDTLFFLLRDLPSERSLFLTSRFLEEQYALSGQPKQIEIRATDEDLWSYIDGRIQTSSRLLSKVQKDRKLQGHIKSLITQKAGGMFLLAKLHVENIESRHTIRDVRVALENLPEGRNTITETYDNIMERINDQSPTDRELAENILLWISHIQRPLTLRELQVALTIREGDTELDLDDLIPRELFISTCAGLVHVEKDTNRIQFVHSTVQEYIQSIKSSRYPEGDVQIATTCIRFLSLGIFRMKHDVLTIPQFLNLIPTYPFLQYAACHWGLHARLAVNRESRASMKAVILGFIDLGDQLVFALRVLLSSIAGPLGCQCGESLAKNPRAVKQINIFAYFGLDCLLEELLNVTEEAVVDSLDGILGNVLHWASLGEHASTLRLLLSHRLAGTIIDQPPNQFTPLHLAAEHRKEVSASILLEYGADVTSRSNLRFTPIHCAAQQGLGSVIGRVLSTESWREVILYKNIFGRTALHEAAVPGHSAVIDTLLQILDTLPISPTLDELQDNLGRNPLHVIAEWGHSDACRIILASKYGIGLATSKDSRGRVPVQIATAQGRVKVVEQFMKWDGGRLFTEMPEIVRGALLLAAQNGQHLVTAKLLDSLHEFCWSDGSGMTPLHYAASSGDIETVKVILQRTRHSGVLETTNMTGDTALFCAANRGHAETVQYLIQEGANVNARNQQGQQPLHSAIHSGVGNVIRILLRSGADVNAEDLEGRTPLSIAADNRAFEATALLLTAHAQTNKVPNNSRGFLWLQSQSEAEIIQGLNCYPVMNDDDRLKAVYPPQRPKDQFRAYFYIKAAFKQQLAPYLISYILDLAEYWIVNTTERSEYTVITECEFNNTAYLRSAPITGNPESPVRRIEFNITSHDQGWCDNESSEASYSGSWTWFEASGESAKPINDEISQLAGPEIVSNVRASSTWKRHQVSWPESLVRVFDCGDHDEHQDREVAQFYLNPVDNPPVLLRWIRGIRPSDRVCVNPRARFPGWENHIRRAEVTIYTSCLLRPVAPQNQSQTSGFYSHHKASHLPRCI